MTAIVNVNGKITDETSAVVSVFDHGFLYGEGVYETLRTYSRRPFLLDRHLLRLRNSAGMIALGVPLSDEQFANRIAETTAAASAGAPRDTEWYIRVLLTRGVGELTYDPAATPIPTVVTIVKPHVDPPAELYMNGVRVILSSIVRNHPDTVNPMIKSNNLMNCALAMQQGYRLGAFEVIMRNYRGELAEGSVSNLFIVKNGTAQTPPLSAGLLPGINNTASPYYIQSGWCKPRCPTTPRKSAGNRKNSRCRSAAPSHPLFRPSNASSSVTCCA